MAARKYDPICSFDGCDKAHWSKGYCGTHYNQHWRGVPLTPRFSSRRRPYAAADRDAQGQKECPECGQWLATQRFTKSSTRIDGLAYSCRGCAKRRAAGRRETAWAIDLRGRYGITAEEYKAKLAAQGNACAICRTTDPGKRRFSVDHDHSCCPGTKSCGRCVRGLLCGPCNAGIGMLGEDPQRIEAAITYLSETKIRMWAV